MGIPGFRLRPVDRSIPPTRATAAQRPARRRRSRGVLAGVALLALVPLAACGAADARSNLRGAVLEAPLPKPDFTLADTHGRPFDFRAQTAGRLTLLYFGFTHCDDICPETLRNIAGALHALPADVARRTRVVFVTVDPARDTPPVLRAWLDHFDASFVGLSGSDSTVARVEQELKLAPTMRGMPGAHGGYDVGHSAEVLAFSPDGRAHAAYSAVTTQDDWRNDLPLLLSAWPAPVGH